MTDTRTRVWMITGVSSGFGRALAEAVLKTGETVVGTVRNEAAKASFEKLGPGKAIAKLMDVTDEAAVHATVKAVEEETGGIDILVNNAGYGFVGGVEEASMAEIKHQFEVNVFGAVAVLQAVLPFMRARRAGHLINISSVSGLVGWASLGIYTGSKFALEGICETLAQEVAPLGIKSTLIEPGGFRTEFALGSRITSARQIPDYDASVGENRRISASHQGHEPGDPAKAAQAIIQVANAEKPPLRLLLGTDAWGYVGYKTTAHQAELAEWKDVTLSMNYD